MTSINRMKTLDDELRGYSLSQDGFKSAIVDFEAEKRMRKHSFRVCTLLSPLKLRPPDHVRSTN